MSEAFKLLFLGAGFSQPAGLPLGVELFQAVRRSIIVEHGRDNHVEWDLERYIRYLNDCEGCCQTADTIDYEQFLGFLDVEHYLGLKGKDTWSEEGNESQLMVRRAIAQVLFKRTPEQPPTLYREFVRRLKCSDIILTFNYDTLLESALEAEGVPYRLFLDRFSEIGWRSNTVDNSKDEVVVLKLHGSIDWFDRAVYDRHVAMAQECPNPYQVKHPVFGKDRIVGSTPLTDGPRAKNDPLAQLYRVRDLRPLLARGFWECCPLILAPSQNKLFYAQSLREFWRGLQRAGGFNLSLGVVGYSLPPYDAYARQVIYHVFSNYTDYEPDLEFNGRKKGRIRILDYRLDGDSGDEIRTRYRYADWRRTDLRLDGFCENTLEWLLA
ncbi:MAG: SIR2 family protein [Deltaproteobacteria bacterium]|nr:SIR2 family protein [Deltaproteobacteria bacterium]